VDLIGRDGYGHLTMEAIAREAGVSKQTLYRWWPTKAAIVLEALSEGAAAIAPAVDTAPSAPICVSFCVARWRVRAGAMHVCSQR
jgi:AcrR family transcriptional regulator